MIKAQDLAQVKAFARQDGVLLSLLWIISFACWYGVMRHTGNNADISNVQQMDTSFSILSLLSNLLIIATPFFVGWRLVRFRDDALNGAISSGEVMPTRFTRFCMPLLFLPLFTISTLLFLTVECLLIR